MDVYQAQKQGGEALKPKPARESYNSDYRGVPAAACRSSLHRDRTCTVFIASPRITLRPSKAVAKVMLGAGIVAGRHGAACRQLRQPIAIAPALQLAASTFLWRPASGHLAAAVSRIWDISWALFNFWLACEAKETCCAVEGESKAC